MEGSLVDMEPRVPDGRYQVGYLDYSTRRIMGRFPKLLLRFKIADGKYTGLILPRYYGVRELKGKPADNGRFKVGPKSDFARDFFRLFPVRVGRLDRMPMSYFDGCLFEVDVATVTHDADQREIPEPLQYSVITDIRKLLNR